MISLALKDRGIIKWQSAAFLPEQVSSLKDLLNDYYSTEMPVLDEYQVEEFENKINLAIEYSFRIKFTTWEGGYNWEYLGIVKKIDSFSKTIYLELSDEEKYTMKINFEDIVRIDVLD